MLRLLGRNHRLRKALGVRVDSEVQALEHHMPYACIVLRRMVGIGRVCKTPLIVHEQGYLAALPRTYDQFLE